MKEIFREVASLVIYNSQLNKFLVQDRASISKYGEEVSFFVGGLDEGETPLQAAKRESIEELGQEFKHYVYIDKFIHDINGKDYIRHLFFITTEQEKFHDLEGDGGIRLSLQEAKTKRYTTDITKEFNKIEEVLKNIN